MSYSLSSFRRSRLIFFLLFFGYFSLVSLLSASDEIALQGKVSSLGGNPISGAVVWHRDSGAKATTGEDGSFTLQLERAERITLEVYHADYADGLFQIPAKSFGGTVVLTLSPLIRQNEEVVVTALRFPEPTARIPAASTVLAATAIGENQATNLTQVLSEATGVAPLGTGGFSMVPAIRGMARNRILILIDNARITSDRRTGPNASFVSPEDIDRIEVLRSPSSIFYGSDAIGGVIHIFTKSAREDGIHGTLHAGYGTNGDNAEYGLNLSGKKGPFSFYLSGQNNRAEDYKSPDGTVGQSRYKQAGFFGRAAYETDARRLDLSFLLGRGTDIGKAASNTASKPTWYPRENQNLAQFHWTEKNLGGGALNVMAYANPNYLETRTDTLDSSLTYVSKAAYAKTESTEFGAQVSYSRMFGESFRLTGGIDLFGRGKAGAVNDETSYDAAGNVKSTVHETPFTDGKRRDLGFYLSADYSGIADVDLIAGLRYDRINQSARPHGEDTVDSNRNAVTGFFGISYRMTENWTVFANISRAYRAPGLSELFYSGISGRGVIISNPDLTPENSVNGDLGVRYIGKRFYAGLFGFLYGIDDLIDRYTVADKVYSYLNVEDARIKGIEFEFEYYPAAGLKFFGNASVMKGESRVTGATINDIPPFRAQLGGRYQWRSLSFELSAFAQAKKDNPGPAEIAIPAYQYFQARVGYDFNTGVGVFVLVKNFSNEAFLGRPDPDGVYEPGRSFIFGGRYSF